MSFIDMFTVPLIQFDCDNWQTKKQKINQLKDFSNFEFRGNVNTDFYKQDRSKINTVYEIFENEINKFKNEFSIEKIKLIAFWFETSLKNNFHAVHHHGPFGYSAVCYVDYCEKFHNPLTFVSPFNNFLTGETLFYKPENVKEGTILFFPSSILHFTIPNFSNEARTVISFNLNVQ